MTRTFEKSSTFPVSVNALYDWHARKGAFERLVPPWEDIRVVSSDHSISEGSKLIMELHRGPGWVTWEARHGSCQHPALTGIGFFTDTAVRGPFKSWVHRHEFAGDHESSTLRDFVQYELPVDSMVPEVLAGFGEAELERMFEFRHRRTAQDLARHTRYSGEPMKIAISGATGLIGKALSALLTTGGHEVLAISRTPGPDTIEWDINAGKLDAAALEGLDAVVHLAGESISGRWTDEKKRRILKSRVDGTTLLAETLAKLQRPPSVFVSASAIGYYGDRKDLPTNELSEAGEGFLPDVCKAWEDASKPAEDAGIRVVNPRIGVVLSAQGGALKPMLPAFKLGLGGPIGDGRQYMSWIAIDDVIGAILHLIKTESLSGPVNLTAPNPVQNRDFVKALADVLSRPSVIPLPSFAVKAAMGEMGDALLLEGARVYPEKLLASGFDFHFSKLEEALRFQLGKSR
ncbi:TIGR01777 family protein [Microvenator marinus]|jgi:hypothetical protein|uniref:TIGR01777 family protein n=1 Tax=Microvenator marinus TaxID=2600177 RepID=A0A5B8XUD0_9DELT|nr:TIGR01777 family oxidoreductase [Microvenator marinus]QED26999.1 TIGR01777 family protein [Microvenator marinus]